MPHFITGSTGPIKPFSDRMKTLDYPGELRYLPAGDEGEIIDMAEIKSTLELIMERTKNLTLTQEEKESLHRKEAMGKIKGSVQKYLDGLISAGALEAEMEDLGKNAPDSREMLESELREHIDPESENRKIFEALEQILGIETRPLRDRISRFRQEIEAEKENIEDRLKRTLEDRNISGSAVIPNPAQSEAFQARIRKMKEDFKKEISAVRGN